MRVRLTPPCFKLGPGFSLGAFSFVVMVLFVPGLSAPATTPRWALLAAVVPAIAMFTECRRFTTVHGLGVLILSYAALTLLWTPNGWDGLRVMAELLILAGLFHIGAEQESLRPVYIGAALGLSVSSLLAVMQAAGLDLVDRADGPAGDAAGLFMNRNYLAEPAVLVLIGLIGNRLWRFVPLVIPAIMPVAVLMPWNYGGQVSDLLAMPMSRGALAGLAVVGAVWLWPRSRLSVILITGAAGGALFALMNPSASHRLVMWAATLDGMTWLGNGIGSFYTLFPSHAPGWDFLIDRPTHAHNDWLEVAYELGAPGAGLVAALLISCLFIPNPTIRWVFNTERLILLALITEGCFGFPLHFPATVFLGGLVAGQLCRARPLLRDVLARGGMALCEGLERLAFRLGAVRPCDDIFWRFPPRPPY